MNHPACSAHHPDKGHAADIQVLPRVPRCSGEEQTRVGFLSGAAHMKQTYTQSSSSDLELSKRYRFVSPHSLSYHTLSYNPGPVCPSAWRSSRPSRIACSANPCNIERLWTDQATRRPQESRPRRPGSCTPSCSSITSQPLCSATSTNNNLHATPLDLALPLLRQAPDQGHRQLNNRTWQTISSRGCQANDKLESRT